MTQQQTEQTRSIMKLTCPRRIVTGVNNDRIEHPDLNTAENRYTILIAEQIVTSLNAYLEKELLAACVFYNAFSTLPDSELKLEICLEGKDISPTLFSDLCNIATNFNAGIMNKNHSLIDDPIEPVDLPEAAREHTNAEVQNFLERHGGASLGHSIEIENGANGQRYQIAGRLDRAPAKPPVPAPVSGEALVCGVYVPDNIVHLRVRMADGRFNTDVPFYALSERKLLKIAARAWLDDLTVYFTGSTSKRARGADSHQLYTLVHGPSIHDDDWRDQ